MPSGIFIISSIQCFYYVYIIVFILHLIQNMTSSCYCIMLGCYIMYVPEELILEKKLEHTHIKSINETRVTSDLVLNSKITLRLLSKNMNNYD